MKHKVIGRLPLNRKEQISYLIKYETSFLFLYGLISFLFMLPLLVAYFWLILTVRSNVANNLSTNEMLTTFITFGLIIVPCVFISGIGHMGLVNNIRELTFESSSHLSSFFKGIKRNFKSLFAYYLLVSISVGLLIANIGFYSYSSLSMGFKLLILIVNIIILLILFLVRPYVLFEGSLFNNPTIIYIRNGFYFAGKNFGIFMMNFAIFVLPYLALIFLPINLLFIPISLLAVGYLSLCELVNYLTNLLIFENNVSPSDIPTIYHVGLEETNSQN